MSSRVRKEGHQTQPNQGTQESNGQPNLENLKKHLAAIKTDDPLIEGSILTLRSYADEEINKGTADTMLTGFRQMAQRDRDLYFMDRIR